MKEQDKELSELNENGKEIPLKQENSEKVQDKNKFFSFSKILLFIVVGAILIFGIIYIIKIYKKMNSKIELIITENYDEMSKKAADIIADIIKKNPNAHLGLATGGTPIGLYKELINKYQNKEISFKNIKTFNLDEYCDIPIDHKQSYYTYMQNNLFSHIDIDPKNTFIPKGEGDILKNIQEYEKLLEKYKINMQLLGIGSNGHIGFNEPGTKFDMGVHQVLLTQNTIKDNARFFDDDIDQVPKKAITMGIKNIIDAECIILVANGENKADAIKSIMDGKIDINIPATALNTHKGKVYIIIDKKAACKL